ncbi:unnamed protein product [Heterobilharzia americana]|nr:unnamed protein product [Heterobilharzia americana]
MISSMSPSAETPSSSFPIWIPLKGLAWHVMSPISLPSVCPIRLYFRLYIHCVIGSWLVRSQKVFQSKAALEDAVCHIIADIFAKDLDIIRKAEELCLKFPAILVTSKKSKRDKTHSSESRSCPQSMLIDGEDDHENFEVGGCAHNGNTSAKTNDKLKDDLVTFKNYLNFSRSVSSILAHQVLAINRASERGVITVKVNLSSQVQQQCGTFVSQKYFSAVNRIHWDYVMLAFNDAWKRLIDPHLVRSIRAKLTTSAQDASLEVFTENLRRLLMTAPLRNSTSFGESTVKDECDTGMISSASGAPGDRLPVVGLDPGWRNGCKWAACDPHGNVLATGALTAVMQRHQIETVALGNGQGSRQTGCWLAHLIQIEHFKPLNIRYAVVSESGASYYSASKMACTELPDLDVSFRGAVSIARRLQDPLAELVKLEPKHLGVAGLSEARAKSILAYRAQIGPFRCRADLLKVKGIGQATYAQCAGFVRVKPTYSAVTLDGTNDDCDDELACDVKILGVTSVSTGGVKRKLSVDESNVKRKKPRLKIQTTDQFDVNCFNPLDQTAVHPDSYEVGTKIISLLGFRLTDVGSASLRAAATQFMLSADSKLHVLSLLLLNNLYHYALSRPLDFDERQDCFTPLFHSFVMKISDLRKGMQVKGRVENVTTFGAFCDIGVEENAYIPRHAYPQSCQMSKQPVGSAPKVNNGTQNMFTLRLGDRVKATVASVDVKYHRISLDRVTVI